MCLQSTVRSRLLKPCGKAEIEYGELTPLNLLLAWTTVNNYLVQVLPDRACKILQFVIT